MMPNWNELFDCENQPKLTDVSAFIQNPCFSDLCASIERRYAAKPQLCYSSCTAQPGWNIKYRKGGSGLCTLYPMEGYFIALVVVAQKQQARAEALLPTFSEQIQAQYRRTPFSAGGRWLMIEVRDDLVLDDIRTLISLRADTKTKKTI